jgi:hypothetical protein
VEVMGRRAVTLRGCERGVRFSMLRRQICANVVYQCPQYPRRLSVFLRLGSCVDYSWVY